MTAAKVQTWDVGDLIEVGGASVATLRGGEEPITKRWTVGSEVTQFDANCFALAKVAECLNTSYAAELDCPPVSVVGGSSRTFLHDELLYKILLRSLRVG